MLNDQGMMTWCTSQIMAACGIVCDETPKCTVYKVDLVYQVHTCQKRYEEVV